MSGSTDRRFPCGHCQAEQTFDVVRGMLRCEYCGTVREVPAGPTPAHPGERTLADGLRIAAQPVADAPTAPALSCKECGAAVMLGAEQLTGTCAFCGTASVVPGVVHRRALGPDSVLPFSVEKRVAAQAFAQWLGRLWLRPTDLQHLAALDSLRGVYVPFWVFGARVESQWSAESGRYYYVADDRFAILGDPPSGSPPDAEADDGGDGGFGVQGGRELPATRRRRVRKTRWRTVTGQRADVHRDVLVCASLGLKGMLVDRLGSYNLRRLVPYADGYLAGFAAEAYAVELGDGHTRARQQLDAAQLALCARDIEGDTHQNLVVRNRYSDETFRYALLPVWIATYRYRGRPYRFVVSGQTGEVIGQAPYSHLKVALACFLGLAALVLLFYLGHRQTDPGGLHPDARSVVDTAQ